MKIFVKRPSGGREECFEVEEDETIESLRAKISLQDGFVRGSLYYSGRLLENGKTLFDYNILDEARLDLVQKVLSHKMR
jgi:hypothetical protein